MEDQSIYRHEKRFKIIDYRKWWFECNNKKVPATWIKNMSPHGVCINAGAFKKYLAGDKVSFKIKFSGEDFIDVQGIVKWVRPSDILNLDEIGIEFLHPLGTIPGRWERLNINAHVKEIGDMELNRAANEL